MSDEVEIVPQIDGIRGKCRHFNGITQSVCKAGVAYDDVRTEHGDKPVRYRYEGERTVYQRGRSLPCFQDEAKNAKPCASCSYYTPEEVEAFKEEAFAIFGRSMKAREAIVADCGGPWKKGMPEAAGRVDCPICKAPDRTLTYKRSAYNGHIHAHCLTKDCVSWME
jgi:hypothetical protein